MLGRGAVVGRAFETGVRMLPVAASLAVLSLVSPRLAVLLGSKVVVAGGLGSLTAAFLWISTTDIDTPYLQVVGQMILLGADRCGAVQRTDLTPGHRCASRACHQPDGRVQLVARRENDVERDRGPGLAREVPSVGCRCAGGLFDEIFDQ